jgi:hypothetical protein
MNGALKGLQLILGILLGLIGLGAIAGGVGYYFFVTQLSTRPPKPIFAEERKVSKPVAKVQSKPKTAIATAPSPSANPKESNENNQTKKLSPNAYSAKVIWKDGLSLKKEPDSGAEKTGGVGYNEKVAIIKESDDRQWLLIRSESSDSEGWVKAGNIDKTGTSEANDAAAQQKKPVPKSDQVTPKNPQPKVSNPSANRGQ